MSIYKELINKGIKPNEISSHCSDLYVVKNAISEQYIQNYTFRESVSSFISQVDGEIWYDIPFGYWDEYISRRKGGKKQQWK